MDRKMKRTDQDFLDEIRELAFEILQKNLSPTSKISIADIGDHCLITFSVKVDKRVGFKPLSSVIEPLLER